MESQRQWSTAAIPPEERFAAWAEILSATQLPFAVDMGDRPCQDFAATVHENTLGEMSLVRTSESPHRGRRTARQVAANTCDVIGLSFVESGRQAVGLGDERVMVGPDDGMIWDGEATGCYEILDTLTTTTLLVPRSLAATALPSYRRSFVQTLPSEEPPARALIQVLSVLNGQLPTMSEGAREASALLVTELLKPLNRRQGEDDPAPSGWPALQLRERILDYIDDNLHDPKLGPSMVAAAHAVSVRTVYSAVSGLGMTLGSYIRHRRLARSYDELLFSGDPVGMVARRWGFASPAHFSRVFQDRYGVPPSRIRRQYA